MGTDLIFVLGLLCLCAVLFAINRPRMDVVALLVILALPLSGVLTINEALAGFSDPSVILIGLLFVVGEGLVRTGVVYRVSDLLMEKAGKNEAVLIALLMVAVASMGSVMSSTGIVAIFIPVVLSLATRLRMHPGRLMMPLSFAGLISGMMTLVATPPNLILDGALRDAGKEGFGFFSVTPIGAVVLVVGVCYMLVARRWLAHPEEKQNAAGRQRRNFGDFIQEYHLADRECRLRVLPGSDFAGKMLQELGLRHFNANVVAVERPGRFNTTELRHPHARMEIREGDVLLIDMFAEKDSFAVMQQEARLEQLPLSGGYFTDQSREVGMAELAVPPESSLIGKTVLDYGFRSKYGLNVIGLKRDRKALQGNLLEDKLKQGDMLLVIGPWKAIRQMQGETGDLLVLSLPAEVDEVAPAASRAPYALLCLALMVGLMVTGVVHNVLAVLITCLLLGALRCIDLPGAYKSINWQSLVLIVGMIPFARALEKTGGIDWAVGYFMELMDGTGPRMLLACLFVFTAVVGLFVSNTATAVLMAPIALKVAESANASPLPFAMMVALAASAAFMTPVSSPVNTLVMGPGQYRFADFVKVGVPFTVLVLIISVVLVPWLFPL